MWTPNDMVRPVAVVLFGFSRLRGNLVEQLVKQGLEQATVVRIPRMRGVNLNDPGASVLIVTSAPVDPPTLSLPDGPPVTILAFATDTGRFFAYPVSPEPTILGELTPALLRQLARGGKPRMPDDAA